MKLLFPYLSAVFALGILVSETVPVFSNLWYILVFFSLCNIIVIAAHEFYKKYKDDNFIFKTGIIPDNDHNSNLSIARLENDVSRVTSVWQGRHIRFFETTSTGTTQISQWERDRYGNITGKSGSPITGLIHSDYYSGGFCRAHSQIQFENNMINDYQIIWYRLNGNRFMDFIMSGDSLDGTFNTYHKNNNLKKTGHLKDGRAQNLIKTYYDTGEIMSLFDYKSGRKEGAYTRYYPDGGIMETGARFGSKLGGYIKNYYENGILKNEKYYINNVLMFAIEYNRLGLYSGQTFTREFKTTAADDYEINSFRRLAVAREKLAKHNMELFDPQSNNFPRIRAICSHTDKSVLKEFSCEEELISFVLNSRKFKLFTIRRLSPKTKAIIKHFNNKGKLVRFK